MPTVPVIDQTATPATQFGAPSVAPVRNSAPQQQQAMGQATQQAGEFAYKTGATIGDRLAEQVDDAKVKAAETAALNGTQTLLYDPQTGYLNQKGQAAIDGYDAAKQGVVKAFQSQLEGLSNPIQQHMFQQVMNQHLLSYGQQMSEHNFQQTSQYSAESAVSRATSYATKASNAASTYGQTDADGNPTGDFYKNLKVAEQETLNATKITKGAPAGSDVANEALLGLHSQVGSAVLSQMMDQRSPYAKVQTVYEDLKAKGMLDLRSMDTLGKMVKTYSEQEMVRNAVQQQLSDAFRASQKQPTTSTGTPDYQFAIKGATVTAQPYDPEQGAVSVTVPQGTSIQAPADGKVLQAGKDEDGNFSMQIQHGDGSVTKFTGLSAANVKAGDQVQRGEDVAASGAVEGTPAVMWSLADKNGHAVDPTKAGLAPVDNTKITDENVLHAALNGVRSEITDPYLQQQATTEMEMFVRHNQQMANAAHTQIYKQAGDAFYGAGYNWRAIPGSVFSQLTPEEQQKFKEEQTAHVLQQYNQGQEFKTMSETDILSDFIANPDKITTDNVEQARPQLSRATYLQLLRQAQSQESSPDSVVEANAINERIRYFGVHSGVNVEPKTPEDKQKLIDLTYKVQQDINQLKVQNNGKATADQVDQAIQRELIQHQTLTPRSPWNPLAFLGISPNVSTSQYYFQSAPKVGDTRTFPNGKTGTWDGKGWVAQ